MKNGLCLRLTHLDRVTLAMKEDEPLDPIHVSSLGSLAVVASANRLPHLIEEFWFRRDDLHRAPRALVC